MSENENKPIYIWSIGSEDRPASDDDIKETEKELSEKIEGVKHVVLPHTTRLMGGYKDGLFYYPESFPLEFNIKKF